MSNAHVGKRTSVVSACGSVAVIAPLEMSAKRYGQVSVVPVVRMHQRVPSLTTYKSCLINRGVIWASA